MTGAETRAKMTRPGRKEDMVTVKVMARVSPWCLVLAGEPAAAN